VARWAPGPGALGALFLLGVFFAQPILLWGARHSLDPVVAEHRNALLEQHARGSATQGDSDIPPLHAAGSYERSLSRCEFVALRLTELWSTPDRPLGLTALIALILVSPLLLPHLTHLRDVRAYERLRWEKARELVLAEEMSTQHAIAERLARFPEEYSNHLSVVPTVHGGAS
jgi:hypothetical protein